MTIPVMTHKLEALPDHLEAEGLRLAGWLPDVTQVEQATGMKAERAGRTIWVLDPETGRWAVALGVVPREKTEDDG